MLFDSYQFAVFFPLVCGLFWALPQRFRWLLLLVASYYFYMCWRPEYALVLVVITAIDFSVGLGLARATRPNARLAILLASLAANLGILFFFKYYKFTARSLNGLAGNAVLPALAICAADRAVVPHVSIDGLHDRRLSAEDRARAPMGTFRHFHRVLSAARRRPDRAGRRLIAAIADFPDFDYHRVTNGLKLIAWGLFKKMVIADRLARLVDPVYANPESQSGLMVACGDDRLRLPNLLRLFRLLGHRDRIGRSFGRAADDRTFAHRTIRGVSRDFWTRWHISLSTWFRDYVYIPLGGNRVSTVRWVFNIVVVFLLSGIWHGANWTFFAWGLYHALC